MLSTDFDNCISEIFLQRPQVFFLASENMGEKERRCINPYQKTEMFLKNVLLKYSEISGDTSFLLEKKSGKKMICFYSPCGGSGKTTLALALAEALFHEGKTVLYLNFDPFFSINGIFEEQEKGGFSQVLLALKQSAGNQFFVAASQKMKHSRISGVRYFSDLENPYDLEDVKETEIEELLKQIMQMKEIDIVIVDTESALTFRSKKTLEYSDLVFMPMLDDMPCRNKKRGLEEAATVSALLENVLKKGVWIINRSDRHSKLAQSMGNDCMVIPELPDVREAEKIDKIWKIMGNTVSKMCIKAMEGCES